ncbi:hypothetical protein SLEP1_g29712 [Rubroshorea leprosula]|uniref:Disease resistance protein RGA3 n=1 Tax=Rubroshorea leprosula TaxID=152421 RepID=A0AAV5K7N3_9ROSI|nr:hypothetical protein SLEP1_g29712 [Rubroshorea leprosula]
MVDAIISFVLDQLKTTIVDKASEEVGLLVGIEEEVEKLERNLRLINTVLRDAEEKKRRDDLVKEWLDSLKEASYDMGDALDEWRTTVEIEALEAQNAASRKRKLCNFISSFSIGRVYTRRKIALNVKEINQRLDDIVKEKEKYQLQLMSICNTINHPQQRPETSSFVDVSKLCGRGKEKAEILNYLWGRSGEEETVELITTISIVGMGGLGKTALAQLICNDDDVKGHFDRVIWVCVSDLFNERRVARAIIQGLEKPTGAAAYGLESNPLQVLLERISSYIQGMKYFLVLDDVWDGNKGERWEGLKTTFKFGAPGSRILVTTRDAEVAKMMGSSSSQIIFLEKLTDEQCWSIVKHIALEGRHDQNLEKIGREIAEKWSDGNADLESKGEEYFRILVDRSFFQDFRMFEGELLCCKMHDILHDFASHLAENEFAMKEINSDHLTVDGSKNRHLRVMIDARIPFPTSISGAEKLRTLITFTREGALTYEALGSLFNHCRRLRVLSFAWPDGTDHLCKEIPEGIGKLIHLRFFHLGSSQKLERLPEALCNLLNLECLDLWNCGNLKRLPDSIGKLINLRYLYTAGCSALTQYPKGVQKLTSLRYLSGLIARADRNDAKEFCLADLGNLKHLRVLHLKVVGNSIDMEQAGKAQLQDTQSLHIFLAGSIQRADIIEALYPHRNIPYLRFYSDYGFGPSERKR